MVSGHADSYFEGHSGGENGVQGTFGVGRSLILVDEPVKFEAVDGIVVILFCDQRLKVFFLSDFGRYVSQTEYSVDEPSGMTERISSQQKSTINNIPPLMSLTITPPPPPPPIMTTSIQQTPIISSSVIKEKYVIYITRQ